VTIFFSPINHAPTSKTKQTKIIDLPLSHIWIENSNNVRNTRDSELLEKKTAVSPRVFFSLPTDSQIGKHDEYECEKKCVQKDAKHFLTPCKTAQGSQRVSYTTRDFQQGCKTTRELEGGCCIARELSQFSRMTAARGIDCSSTTLRERSIMRKSSDPQSSHHLTMKPVIPVESPMTSPTSDVMHANTTSSPEGGNRAKQSISVTSHKADIGEDGRSLIHWYQGSLDGTM